MSTHRYTSRTSSGRLNWRVNMTPAELRAWLKTPESKSVGFVHEGETESVGRQSARKIIRILEQGGPKDEADEKWMRKVAGYNARHLAQRPSGDVSNTRWLFSLKNWGHDPMKARKS